MEKDVETKVEDTSMVNTGVPEFTEEQKEYARMTVRKEFNDNFSKWATIADENATDDDIAKAKADFEEAVEETKKRTYTLATAEGNCAYRAAKLLLTWSNTMNVWQNGEWRGVIAFDKYMCNKMNKIKANDKLDLVVDYQTLVFLYNTMSRPVGTGIEAAWQMAKFENYDTEKNEVSVEEFPVTFSGILEKVQTEVNMLSNIDKKLTILKERVNLAYAGLNMVLKITELEEFIEFADAINRQTVENTLDDKE